VDGKWLKVGLTLAALTEHFRLVVFDVVKVKLQQAAAIEHIDFRWGIWDIINTDTRQVFHMPH
jgi:hypothetical protein